MASIKSLALSLSSVVVAASESSSELKNHGIIGHEALAIHNKLIVEWSNDSPSALLRKARIEALLQDEAPQEDYLSLLPSRQPEGVYGASINPATGERVFSADTIQALIQKYFNGRFYDDVPAEDVPEISLMGAAAQAKVAHVQRLNSLGVDIIVTPSSEDADALLEALRSSPHVLHVERDQAVSISPALRAEPAQTAPDAATTISAPEDAGDTTISAIPNDRHFSLLWGMNNGPDTDVNGPELWAEYQPSDSARWGADPIVVGVLDTGAHLGHEDLKGQLWTNPREIPNNGIDDDGNGYVDDVHGWDFFNNDRSPEDDNMHGSHCAGTILGTGDNGVGVAGVWWGAKLMPLKTMNARGSGSYSASIQALNYAAAMGAHVTNNSWGGPSAATSLRNALRNAPILHVAAAGNDSVNNDSRPSYPAQYTLDLNNVISIAAIQGNGALASFSNYGARSVDVAAPGVDIASTCLRGSYCYASGTSMATPHVTGVAAAMLARGREMVRQAGQSPAKYGPFPEDLKEILQTSAKRLSSLNGRLVTPATVDAYAAVKAVEALMNSRLGNGPTPSTSTTSRPGIPTTTTTTTQRATTTTTTTRRTTTTTTRAFNTCQIGQWSQWSGCSAQCGMGTKKRTRTVSGGCPVGTATSEQSYCYAGLCSGWWNNLWPFGGSDEEPKEVEGAGRI